MNRRRRATVATALQNRVTIYDNIFVDFKLRGKARLKSFVL